jgi:hypothetical protein
MAGREILSDSAALVYRMRDEILRLRAALTISRGQWIHSVNAVQCLEALGEPVPEYVRNGSNRELQPLIHAKE